MGKRTASFVLNVIKLAIVLSLVVSGAGAENDALAIDTHSARTSAAVVVAVNGVTPDCIIVDARSTHDDHDGNFKIKHCCGTTCSILAILTPIAAIRFVRQTNIEANADCRELASVVPQNLHRPPIA